MKEDISQLRELQSIDLKISQLDKEIAAGTGSISKRKAGIEARQATISQLSEKIAANEQRRRELEAELADETARIKDRQTKLMNVQTNREYQSLLKETEDIKKANKQREDAIVQLMEQTEALNGKISEESNLCSGEESLLAEELAKVEKQAEQLNAEKNKIMKTRESKAGSVTAALLKKYNILREKRNGLAVVEVTNGVCRGCFMNIPPQLFNDLMKEDKLISCPTCHRIMFHQPETQEA
ncbi:zinc ribbon domain-containing protein [Thiovibrio sp. JS02]